MRTARRWLRVLVVRGALEGAVTGAVVSLLASLPFMYLAVVMSTPADDEVVTASGELWFAVQLLSSWGARAAAGGAVAGLLVAAGTGIVVVPWRTRHRGLATPRARRAQRAVAACLAAAVPVVWWNLTNVLFGDPPTLPPLLLVPMGVLALVAWWRAGAVLRAVERAARDAATDHGGGPAGA